MKNFGVWLLLRLGGLVVLYLVLRNVGYSLDSLSQKENIQSDYSAAKGKVKQVIPAFTNTVQPKLHSKNDTMINDKHNNYTQEVIKTQRVDNKLEKVVVENSDKSTLKDGFFNPKNLSSDVGLKFIAKPIPKSLINLVKSLKNPYKLPNCSVEKAKHNFVYIKTHKTASNTLASIFRRFAYDRDLTIVLPTWMKYSIGWPHDLRKEFHRESKSGGFNVLLDHTKYTEKYMREIMPKDTVYISSWRETWSRLKSALAFFYVCEWSGINETKADCMNTFLRDINYYDSVYKVLPPANKFREYYYCTPGDMSMVRNSMAAVLAFPVGFPAGVYPDLSNNFTAIKQWLQHTNEVFSIVLISDHFHESLIMLKRMMCWSHKDILYERKNTWNTKYYPTYRQELIDNLRRWSAADYLAFQFFNRTLWDRVHEWGYEDFMDEVKHYALILTQVHPFCSQVKKGEETEESIVIEASKWDDSFRISRADCEEIYDENDMREKVKQKDDSIAVQVNNPPMHIVPGC